MVRTDGLVDDLGPAVSGLNPSTASLFNHALLYPLLTGDASQYNLVRVLSLDEKDEVRREEGRS